MYWYVHIVYRHMYAKKFIFRFAQNTDKIHTRTRSEETSSVSYINLSFGSAKITFIKINKSPTYLNAIIMQKT